MFGDRSGGMTFFRGDTHTASVVTEHDNRARGRRMSTRFARRVLESHFPGQDRAVSKV